MSIAPGAETVIEVGFDSGHAGNTWRTPSVGTAGSLLTNEKDESARWRPFQLRGRAPAPAVRILGFTAAPFDEPGRPELTARLEPANHELLQGELRIETATTDVEGAELEWETAGGGAWELKLTGPELGHGQWMGGKVQVRTNQPSQREITLHVRQRLKSLFESEGSLDLLSQAAADWRNTGSPRRLYRARKTGAQVRVAPKATAGLLEAFPPRHLLGFRPERPMPGDAEGWTRLGQVFDGEARWVRSSEVDLEPLPGPAPAGQGVVGRRRSELLLRRRDGQPFRILGWSWLDGALPVKFTVPVGQDEAREHSLSVELESWPDEDASSRIRVGTDHPEQRFENVWVRLSR